MDKMSIEEALAIVIDIASRWGENAEEAFPRRIQATDSDEICRQLTGGNQEDLSNAIEIRDLWRAVEILQKEK